MTSPAVQESVENIVANTNASPRSDSNDTNRVPDSSGSADANDTYRQTQSEIYKLQETILNSAKNSKAGMEDDKDDNGNKETEPLEELNVDSTSILKYTHDKYKSKPECIGDIVYDPLKQVQLCGESSNVISVPFPYSYFNSRIISQPLLPSFGRDRINKLLTIRVKYVDILNFMSGNNLRLQNSEVWGTDIYTDDSDVLLMLKHVGFFDSDTSDSLQRTPANLDNFDNVTGVDSDLFKLNKKFDLDVTVILLDCLQTYVGTTRHGVKSRDWIGPTLHDGLSIGLYKIDAKNIQDANTTDKETILHPGQTQDMDINRWR
ncbi:hypothetical protein KAFR_0G03330 [Kazachstania africana CBS 2517]|uniref:Uncharacterized protein n=1 Tax=Kazachstania africana (strain ATCC 22294 / BCRC 22015 / CBS 2517 / CECT 1963 / NBRC 1671 / NRRL Y-8276) TaxID=1071382 RepID=H2AYB5_KAZAF|nr:hypothetical protein KAFR_0G03330 [Kazachstania africana CBS 2517]CCF59365.1 hypothetical protein KAFR_0G03330 [Kazachstania africana CBS 2517]